MSSENLMDSYKTTFEYAKKSCKMCIFPQVWLIYVCEVLGPKHFAFKMYGGLPQLISTTTVCRPSVIDGLMLFVGLTSHL